MTEHDRSGNSVSSPAPGEAAQRRLPSWNLRRMVGLSVVLHVVGLITATVLAKPNFDPPERLDVIPIQILSELAPPKIPERKPTPAPPKPKPKPEEVIPDPLEKIEPKPDPPKPKPEPKPPEPDPPKPKPEPEEKPPVKPPDVKPKETPPEPQTDVKVGAVDAPDLPPIETDRPTLGEDIQIELEGPPFEFAYYIRQMRRKISSKWRPPGADPTGPKISALVRFRVQPDGRVADAEIIESSNSFVFDQAVLRAMEEASPLPPLPKKYVHPQLGVRLRFVLQD